ncbi:F-box only protein [Acrasis kona]|uniref:F-box only protein n=1 Tax=Acrasis kona TaxID=1008807 RepID=A0AAW2YKH9_9EUKA
MNLDTSRFTVVTNFDEVLLPQELLEEIFMYLPLKDIINIFSTCRYFHWIMQQDQVWEQLIEHYHISTNENTKTLRGAFISGFLNECVSKERKLLNLVRELHKRGYVVNCRAGLSPSGCYWRCQIGSNKMELLYSSSDPDIFGINPNLFTKELADAFLEKHPLENLKKEPSDKDRLFIKWFDRVLNAMERDSLYIEFADYELPSHLTVTKLRKGVCSIPYFEDVKEDVNHPFML